MQAVDSYKLLVQRHDNEDRTLAERTNIFLLGNAFLFAGFAALHPSFPNLDLMRYTIPSVGICLTLLGAYLNYMSIKAINHFKEILRSMPYGLEHYPETAPKILRNSVFKFDAVFIFWIPALMVTLWSISLIWIGLS